MGFHIRLFTISMSMMWKCDFSDEAEGKDKGILPSSERDLLSVTDARFLYFYSAFTWSSFMKGKEWERVDRGGKGKKK